MAVLSRPSTSTIVKKKNREMYLPKPCGFYRLGVGVGGLYREYWDLAVWRGTQGAEFFRCCAVPAQLPCLCATFQFLL